MDLKELRHRSLTHGHCRKHFQFNTSSLDHENCRVPTQKSYSSSETLKAFDHESRLHYGGCVAELVHHEAEEFTRPGADVLQPDATDPSSLTHTHQSTRFMPQAVDLLLNLCRDYWLRAEQQITDDLN
ncbi:hypothetical protein DNTS_014564 [Danionella cerebrum]|uniref:Teneurin N-terminal domain-containing protein n=1 Tax=Danionella cerebrum TaxID=2873325 RepID=A0A553MPZ8_9TELE|nr:hypothetical protein DNTS_014564 [Danionella translucida]